MSSEIKYNDELFEDLSEFHKGACMYNNEIFFTIELEDQRIIEALEDIMKYHPDASVKSIAVISQIIILLEKIKQKHL